MARISYRKLSIPVISFTGFVLAWILLAGVLASSWLHAQNAPVEVPTKKDDLEEMQLKSRIEDRLARDIHAYLGHNRFIINVDVTLQKIRQVVKTNTKNKPSNNRNFQAQAYPELRFPKVKRQDKNEVDSLPGLPFMDLEADKEKDAELEFMREQIKRLQKQQREAQWDENSNGSNGSSGGQTEETVGVFNKIKKLVVTLMVEDKVTKEQEVFLRNLVYQKARLNDLRGDELNIVRSQFSEIEQDTVLEAGQAPVEGWMDENFSSLLLGLLSLLALLLLALIFVGLKKKNDPVLPPVMNDKVDAEPLTSQEGIVAAEVGPDQKQKLQKTRQDIISLGLGQPQQVQNVMDSLATQEDKVPMMASIYKVLGRSLFRSIFPNVEQMQLQSIMAHLADQAPDEDQLFQDTQDFYQLLQKKIQEQEPNRTHPFEFLEKLNDSQVLYLVQHEDARIKALVISQLESQQAARVLNGVRQQDQAQVMAELGQFETFPVDTFKDVADRLAKASQKVPSFENVNADGLSMLMNMLDSMSSSEESKVLKLLKQDKPDTFYKLRQQYFTFADLVKTPKATLSNALREVEREFIGRALCNTPDEFKIHVLNALTPKLKALASSDVKRFEGRIAAKDIDPARKAIVHKLREYIHTGKFSMDQLQGAKAKQKVEP